MAISKSVLVLPPPKMSGFPDQRRFTPGTAVRHHIRSVDDLLLLQQRGSLTGFYAGARADQIVGNWTNGRLPLTESQLPARPSLTHRIILN